MRCTRCGLELDRQAHGITVCDRPACIASEKQLPPIELERLDISYRTGRKLNYNELREQIKKEQHANLRIQMHPVYFNYDRYKVYQGQR